MRTAIRTFAAFLAGLALAFILVVAVEMFSAVVHPFPENFGGTEEEVCRHVERCPQWVLAAAVPMWGFTALAATWVAGRLGNRVSALILGLLLIAGVILNISMLPYVVWFKILMPLVVVGAVVYGYLSSTRHKTAASPTGSPGVNPAQP